MLEDYAHLTTEELGELLAQHVHNKKFYRESQYEVMESCTISGSWEGLNKRRIDFKNTKFNGVNLNQAGFTGSTFDDCVFKKNVEMDGVNFSSCNFINCKFSSVTCFAFFNNSKFINTVFCDCVLNNCNFAGAYLNNVTFERCTIISANWESCNFYAVSLNSCSLKKLNFEYALFGDVHFNETNIPFQTIPFIFGGPSYILNTNDNMHVKSVKGNLTPKEYREYLLLSLEFFSRTHNWFPAVNILLTLGRRQDACDFILRGAEEFILLQKFRSLHFLITLANRSTTLSSKDKMHIFQKLNPKLTTLEETDTIDSFDKRLYISTIRSSMLPTERGVQYVTVTTNIPQENVSAINKMYAMIESILSDIFKVPHTINISHNSPYMLDIVLPISLAVIPMLGTFLNTILTNYLSKQKEDKDSRQSLKVALSNFRTDLSDDDIDALVISISQLQSMQDSIHAEAVCITSPPEISNDV